MARKLKRIETLEAFLKETRRRTKIAEWQDPGGFAQSFYAYAEHIGTLYNGNVQELSYERERAHRLCEYSDRLKLDALRTLTTRELLTELSNRALGAVFGARA